MDLYSQLLGSSTMDGRFLGVACALVTNNKDPDGLGRVRLRLPWLADGVETNWVRVATPMAGAGRGVYFVPEVDDEVLVAFEHGNPDTPYVLGALWNGRDKPPLTNSDGRNDVRAITSRSGHQIRLDDTKDGERIEVVDRGGKNRIVIDHKANTISITADGDVTVTTAKGKLTLDATDIEITSRRTIKVKAAGELRLNGNIVNIN